MDGIDVALIDTDGADRVARGPALTISYDEAFRSALRRSIADARQLADRRARPGCLAEVERELTERHAAAVAQFLAKEGLQAAEVDVIGFHGQTVLHKAVTTRAIVVGEPKAVLDTPPMTEVEEVRTLTVQLGDGALLARRTGIDVVWDLRAADCAAGGQGAPLAPVYHRALAARLPQRGPAASRTQT
jgi:anhydro-N-acetylmuramic acid kinase